MSDLIEQGNRHRIGGPTVGRERLRRWSFGLRCLVLGSILFLVSSAGAEEIRLVQGEITYIAATAVEVNGVRGLIGPRSSLVSASREISIAGIRRGMPARLELDAAGRVLELRVSGVVE